VQHLSGHPEQRTLVTAAAARPISSETPMACRPVVQKHRSRKFKVIKTNWQQHQVLSLPLAGGVPVTHLGPKELMRIRDCNNRHQLSI